MGYLATYWNDTAKQTEIGFVSAGHSFINKSGAYDTTGSQLGTVSMYIGNPGFDGLSNTGDVDVAFIKISAGTSVDRTISQTTIQQDTTTSIPAEGSTIYKSGAATGRQPGKVISLYFVNGSDSDNYETTLRRILTDSLSAPGDSGAILYTSPVNNKVKVVGIHQAGGTISGQRRATGIFAFKIAEKGILVR